jgi:hypothetical protein
MPDVTVHGAGFLWPSTQRKLKIAIIDAVSTSMPCKPRAVMARVESEQGFTPMSKRNVTAHIVTMFLYDKNDDERRKTVKRVKETVENAIRQVLPKIHFAEAFIIDAIPPAKEE